MPRLYLFLAVVIAIIVSETGLADLESVDIERDAGGPSNRRHVQCDNFSGREHLILLNHVLFSFQITRSIPELDRTKAGDKRSNIQLSGVGWIPQELPQLSLHNEDQDDPNNSLTPTLAASGKEKFISEKSQEF